MLMLIGTLQILCLTLNVILGAPYTGLDSNAKVTLKKVINYSILWKSNAPVISSKVTHE